MAQHWLRFAIIKEEVLKFLLVDESVNIDNAAIEDDMI